MAREGVKAPEKWLWGGPGRSQPRRGPRGPRRVASQGRAAGQSGQVEWGGADRVRWGMGVEGGESAGWPSGALGWGADAPRVSSHVSGCGCGEGEGQGLWVL